VPISLDESLITLPEAARLLPGRPHVSTLWRWVSRGCRGIRLETLAIGRHRFTSREALERFAAATTAAAGNNTQPPRTSRQRERDIQRAEDELAQPWHLNK
jgi:Protein of unknown function (DUF1580)